MTKERSAWLTKVILIFVGCLLYVLIINSTRVEPDEIRLSLVVGDKPMSQVLVKLVSDPEGSPDCQSGGLWGRTSATGEFNWLRQIRVPTGRPSSRTFRDPIAICVQLSDQPIQVWQRDRRGRSQLLRLACEFTGDSAPKCVAQKGVSVEEILQTVVGVLFLTLYLLALLNRKSPERVGMLVPPLMGSIVGAILLQLASMPAPIRLLLMGALAAWLLFALGRLCVRVFRAESQDSVVGSA